MKDFNWKEFKPALFFLGKFVGLYLVANLLYGYYVTSYEPRPDPATSVVARHSELVLNTFGYDVTTIDNIKKPTTQVRWKGRFILAIYEGCNGINTAIIFIAFIIAFGSTRLLALWFIFGGLIVIHLANLARLVLLFLVAVHYPKYMYFTHKYLFTAALYLVIFVMWFVWVKYLSRKNVS
jgi:exosortase family protein XrtF